MNPPKFKELLLLRLLAVLHDQKPDLLKRVLKRAGFRDGDVTFRKTQRKRTYTTIVRWPWDPHS